MPWKHNPKDGYMLGHTIKTGRRIAAALVVVVVVVNQSIPCGYIREKRTMIVQ